MEIVEMEKTPSWRDLINRYYKPISVILIAVGGSFTLRLLEFLFPELLNIDSSQYYDENFFLGLFYSALIIIHSICLISSHIAFFVAGYFVAEYRIMKNLEKMNTEEESQR
jgi:hypothetical protein